MSFSRTLRSFAILVLMAPAAQPQSRGTGSSNPSRTTTPPATAPRTTTQPPNLNQVIMLSGNVITADGTPLPEPVDIERVCNGRISREGRTDFKGYFTLTIAPYAPRALGSTESTAETNSPGMSAIDALKAGMPQSMSGVRAMLLGCELRGSLAGFRSSNVLIPTGDLASSVGAVKVGTIVLEKMGQSQGRTVSATSLNAPKEARKAYDKGHRAVESNKLPEAQQALEKAVQVYPQYAAAWQDLGWVYAQQNQFDKARDAFTQARSADAMFVPAYVGLASLAVRESKWQEAAEMSARATQLDGVDFPAAFFYNSLANYRLGNLEQAEKSARKAETLGAQRAFPQVNLLLGVMLADRHDYADAADRFRSYLKAAPDAPNADKVRQQLAEFEKLSAAEAKTEAASPAK